MQILNVTFIVKRDIYIENVSRKVNLINNNFKISYYQT